MITQQPTDPSKAFPLTYKGMSVSTEGGAITPPKPTVQQTTAGNLPAGSQKDIAEIDAQIEQQKAEEMAQIQTGQQGGNMGGMSPDMGGASPDMGGGAGGPPIPDASGGQQAPQAQSTFINNKGVDYDASSLL
jgi:hypothetical protein